MKRIPNRWYIVRFPVGQGNIFLMKYLMCLWGSPAWIGYLGGGTCYVIYIRQYWIIWITYKFKIKFSLCLTKLAPHNEDVCGSGRIAPAFLISTLDGGDWPATCPGPFNTEERAHWIQGRMGPRSGLDAVEKKKSLASARNQTLIIQPVACCYTDWATRLYELYTCLSYCDSVF